MSSDNKYRILFVCSGNTCRSPMAEYALRMLLEKERPGQVEVYSAGTLGLRNQPATIYAQEAARIWDLDLSPHRSQGLTPELVAQADLVFAMTAEHHQKIVELDRRAGEKTYLLKNFPDNSPDGEAIGDPIGMDLDYYNEVFLEIGESLGQHLPEIVKRIDHKNNG
ncbi:MAG: low molecular weight protein arginine phosphatase [Candidatus Zixiibacteriota bacterium]